MVSLQIPSHVSALVSWNFQVLSANTWDPFLPHCNPWFEWFLAPSQGQFQCCHLEGTSLYLSHQPASFYYLLLASTSVPFLGLNNLTFANAFSPFGTCVGVCVFSWLPHQNIRWPTRSSCLIPPSLQSHCYIMSCHRVLQSK